MSNNGGAAAGGGAIYGLGIFGAWVYFWQQADGFWEHILAILEAEQLHATCGNHRVAGVTPAANERCEHEYLGHDDLMAEYYRIRRHRRRVRRAPADHEELGRDVVALATLALGFQQDHYGLFLVAAAGGLAFWLIEGSVKLHQSADSTADGRPSTTTVSRRARTAEQTARGRVCAGAARRLDWNRPPGRGLGGKSQPLDLGRVRRLFSPAQRKAMATRDPECRTTAATSPPPGARPTTADRGPPAARPIWPTASACARSTTIEPTTGATT